jgi:hypothetical protein
MTREAEQGEKHLLKLFGLFFRVRKGQIPLFWLVSLAVLCALLPQEAGMPPPETPALPRLIAVRSKRSTPSFSSSEFSSYKNLLTINRTILS